MASAAGTTSMTNAAATNIVVSAFITVVSFVVATAALAASGHKIRRPSGAA